MFEVEDHRHEIGQIHLADPQSLGRVQDRAIGIEKDHLEAVLRDLQTASQRSRLRHSALDAASSSEAMEPSQKPSALAGSATHLL